MSDSKQISPEEHKRQIEFYTAERPRYVAYADALKGVLERACAVALPEAFVQARAKTVSSFAEKCVRKYGKYKDPLHDLTDLCGARVIVQTLEQVEAVKQFVEANFTIHEKDEKGTLLGDDRFGYRDMHYIEHLPRR
jgi:ppGpp synthetase/RelA/SpoT-type nucleotidyltranferase